MPFAITTFFCLSALTLLAHAAWTDRCERLIANRVSLALILLFAVWFGLAIFMGERTLGQFWGHIQVFVIVFALGYALWLTRTVGGGDVKLLSAVAFWAGPGLIMPAVLLMSLAGGILAVALLTLRRFFPATAVLIFGGQRAVCADGSGDMADGAQDERNLEATVPYGVAIALAGAWVVLQHASLTG